MLKTFNYGGVHPGENKLTAHRAIEKIPLPESIFLSTSQHMGEPARIIVKEGDSVRVGQLVAEGCGPISANIHSSVSGTVSKIDHSHDSSGYPQEGIFIQVDGDYWCDEIKRDSEIVENFRTNRNWIIEKIKDAGIVGLGGGAFPTHVKLDPPPGKNAEILIINGVECEPFLTSDHRLMLEHGSEIIIGTRMLMCALDIGKAYIGIENNKRDAIEYMTALVDDDHSIEIVPLKVKYPQGGEKLLIKSVTGLEMPINGLPVDVGVVVNNVGTAYAVYEAVQKNKPLVERVVTVTGKSLKDPSNFLVRIGTPLEDLIKAAGGMPEDTGKILCGGPMMGKAVPSLNIPVNKGTSGVVVVPQERAARRPEKDCIRCSRCIDACCMGLEPYLIMFHSEKHQWDRAESNHILNCIECGSCSYVCPSQRPLLDFIRIGKRKVREIAGNRKMLVRKKRVNGIKKFLSLRIKKDD